MTSPDHEISDEQPKGTPVRSQLTQQLREAITEGLFMPGDRLVERELCERWQVSRASVRESLRQLEAEGLVEIQPHRGPSVRKISFEEMIELKELQRTLESLVARRFALNGSEADMDLLERRIAELESAFGSQDRHNIKLAKLAYFEAFTAGAKSPTLRDYVRQVNARFGFIWASSLMVPGRSAESIGDQRMLLTMIRRRNPDAAEAAIVIHHERAKTAAMQGWHVFEAAQQAQSESKKRTRGARK